MKGLSNVLTLGNSVEDPAKWKKRQIAITSIAGLLTILFNALEYYGVRLPFEASSEIINNISVGLIVSWNGILTLATSTKVGTPPAVKPSP